MWTSYRHVINNFMLCGCSFGKHGRVTENVEIGPGWKVWTILEKMLCTYRKPGVF